jgi:hypothetical protein
MSWRDSRARVLVALGFFLARRGVMAAVSLGLTVACVAGSGVVAFVLGQHRRQAALPNVPLVASSALAFGVGVLVAFTVSTRAFRRDEDEGVRALLSARGVHATGYLGARIAGLAALLALLVGGGSVGVGALTLLASRSTPAALHTVQASFAALTFGLAFAFVFAPVAMATLGARSRGGGYLALLAVLGLPELLRPWLSRVIDPSWLDLLSIPGALAGLRGALAPVGVDLAATGRSVVVLLVVVVAAVAIVRVELLRAHASSPQNGARLGRPPA